MALRGKLSYDLMKENNDSLTDFTNKMEVRLLEHSNLILVGLALATGLMAGKITRNIVV